MAIMSTHKETQFGVGDVVRVHQRLFEAVTDKKNQASGELKSRVQIFEGTVIAIRGNGMGKSVVVRRIGAQGVGMEMIFPLHAPIIEKVEVSRHGTKGVRRAKLYYTRTHSKKEIDKIYQRTHTKEQAVKVKNLKKTTKKKPDSSSGLGRSNRKG